MKKQRCQYGYAHWETLPNGKLRHMQCRKRGRKLMEVKRFFGMQMTSQGEVPCYQIRQEWRCYEHGELPESGALA